MAALCSRCGHYIFVLFLSSFFLLLFPRPISAVADWMSTTWWGLSAKLECRSEMCCTRLAEIQDAKRTQNWPSAHHRKTLSSYIFTTKACIDNRKKNLLNSNIPFTCCHNMVNCGPLTAETDWRVWGTPANFNGVRLLAALCFFILATE